MRDDNPDEYASECKRDKGKVSGRAQFVFKPTTGYARAMFGQPIVKIPLVEPDTTSSYHEITIKPDMLKTSLKFKDESRLSRQ